MYKAAYRLLMMGIALMLAVSVMSCGLFMAKATPTPEPTNTSTYINDQRIGSFYDFSSARSEGYFAFNANQESGQGSCKYENT
jgi:hypothetical protein